MCLIIYGNINRVKKLDLQKAWNKNPDGAGIIEYKADGKITFTKGLMAFDDFMRRLTAVKNNSRVAVHFRMGTHGTKSKENCHPFRVGREGLLMHNGILQHLGSRTDSDSAHFAKILSYLPHKERIPLIKSVNWGRFLYSFGNKVFLIGDWHKYNKVFMSTNLLIPFVPSPIILPQAQNVATVKWDRLPDWKIDDYFKSYDND